MVISTENLAYWYFRLNGFFGNGNFIIHSALGQSAHASEIDYFGVRFAYRQELYNSRTKDWMKDDETSELFKNYNRNRRRTYICLAEVKRSRPKINFTQAANPEVLKQVLLSLGCIARQNIPGIVRRLQKHGFCNTYLYHISFVAIGESIPEMREETIFPKIPIITRDDMLHFIYDRFTDYRIEKSNLSEWGHLQEIKDIKELALLNTFEKFKNEIKIA
jgi:hypothetical protein